MTPKLLNVTCNSSSNSTWNVKNRMGVKNMNHAFFSLLGQIPHVECRYNSAKGIDAYQKIVGLGLYGNSASLCIWSGNVNNTTYI